MDQKTVITRLVLGSAGEIAISLAEFETIRNARLGLHRAHAIEDKFDMLMEDYVELETELLALTARDLYVSELSWDSMVSARSGVNRRLLHLLSTVRLYTDQVKHDFSVLFGKNSSEAEALKAVFAREYDSNLGFRVLEALRNYAQHRSLPVHGISFRFTRPEDGVRTHTTDYSLDLDQLKRDGGFKAETLKELVNAGDKTPAIKPYLRAYVTSLTNVHREARQALLSAVNQWEAVSQDAARRYHEQHGDETIGLSIARIRLDDGQERGLLEEHGLNDEVIKRRKRLEQKNGQLRDLTAHRITSELN